MKSCIKVDLNPMKHLEKALQLDPASPQSAYLFAKTLIQKKASLKAIHFLKDFHKNHGLSENLYNLLAKAYLVEKDFSNAEEKEHTPINYTGSVTVSNCCSSIC